MEPKKYDNQRLELRRSLFLLIGLNVSMLLIFTMFNWKIPEPNVIVCPFNFEPFVTCGLTSAIPQPPRSVVIIVKEVEAEPRAIPIELLGHLKEYPETSLILRRN